MLAEVARKPDWFNPLVLVRELTDDFIATPRPAIPDQEHFADLEGATLRGVLCVREGFELSHQARKSLFTPVNGNNHADIQRA